MDYTALIDQNDKVVLYDDLLRCFGVEPCMLLAKIKGWQDFNRRAENQYQRHGVYWMPARGKDLKSDGKGNINYIKNAHLKIVPLIELGLLSEHLEPSNKTNKPHRWVRVNERAFNRFIELWIEHNSPNSQATGKKAGEAYAKFLEAWESIKTDYLDIYIEPKRDTTDETDEAAKQRNKDIGYIIKAWIDGQVSQPAKKRNEYVIKTNRDIAEALIDNGITPNDVTAFMATMAKPTFYVSMQVMNNNIIGWKKHHEKTKPKGTTSAGVEFADAKQGKPDSDVESAIDDLLEAI